MDNIPDFNTQLLDAHDRARIERQTVRYYLLTQNYGDTNNESNVRPAIDSLIGPERAQLIPAIDFSNNPILTASLQLAVPGLYSAAPKVTHADPRGQELAQIVEEGGYWLHMQYQQFLTAGMGDAILHISVENGTPAFRNVPPFMLVVKTAPENPERLLELKELRLRDLTVLGLGLQWCWDEYDLSDPQNPKFYIETADSACTKVTNVLPGTPADGLVGPAYRWRYGDGIPYIPYAHYAVEKTGFWWHDNATRGLTRATLFQMAFGTVANQSAMDASHSTAIGVDIELPGTPVSTPDGGGGGGEPAGRMAILPGSLLAVNSREGASNTSIHQLRPSADLAQLRMWMSSQEAAVLTRLGLSADDVQFMAANPTSAASLTIRNRTKRQMAQRFAPYFRACDLEVFKMLGAMLGYPEAGYAITYQEIPVSPEERKAELEADELELKLGLISPIDLYQRHNPGTTREDAVRILAQIRADSQILSVT